jgi:ribosomal protein S18 acetylase RimI-like enzyme
VRPGILNSREREALNVRYRDEILALTGRLICSPIGPLGWSTMQPAMSVVSFAPEHVSDLRALLAQHGWEERYVTGQLDAARKLARDPNGHVLVAVDAAGVVGFATVQVYKWNRLAQLHGLAVSPAQLRRGIASQLIAQAEQFAQTRRARGIYVDTPVTNGRARAFYRANGYIEDHVMTRYYADDLDGVTLLKFFDPPSQGA